ncbi:hypothetical protein [Veillonella intestinalis]|uniref:hypothetical protein n=1 Tax=Veillonella intestinalis TaxID=2941341 RepID=UPI00204235C0|nr:hypothetical protein [Veillonella intestinalis]
MKTSELESIIQTITDKIWNQYVASEKDANLNQVFKSNPSSEAMHMMIGATSKGNSTNSNSSDLVIDELTLEELSEVAYLMPHSEKSKQIIQCILEGKPVVVKQRPVMPTHIERLPYALKQQWREIVHACESYGIQFGTEVCSRLKKKDSKISQPIKSSKSIFITVAKLVQLQQNGEKMPIGARLTPLARDYMREHDLKL